MRTFIDVVNLNTMMPNQIVARTTDGEHVYARARHGWLTIHIAPTEDQTFDDAFEVYSEGFEGSGLGYDTPDRFTERFKQIIKENNLGVIAD
jgi:hypothetical protein